MKQTRAFFNRFSIGVTALWLLLFALLPNIGLLVVTVLTRGEQDFVLPQFTLDNYLRLLDPTFLKILWESLWLAFMSTLACLLVGYPFAYRIARASAKMKPWLLLLVIIPFWTNSLIRTYALILILKANGLISTLLVWLGVTEQPVSFMYGDFAVFMGILYTFLPFMVLPLYASIESWTAACSTRPGISGQRLPVVLARHVPADPARYHRGLDARFPAFARGVLYP